MKKQFTLSLALLAGSLMMGCSSSSSASDSTPSYNPEDCTLAEEGIKILLPAGDEEYKIGDSVTIVFVANYSNAGGFSVLYFLLILSVTKLRMARNARKSRHSFRKSSLLRRKRLSACRLITHRRSAPIPIPSR